MKLLTQNSKIKKTSKARGVRLYNFGIPAFLSTTGLKTCPSAGVCAIGCYARSGAYRFSNVAKVFEERLQVTLRPDFVKIFSAELQATRATHVRIHDSGDFYSAEYLSKWINIASVNPDVQFYAYTKNVKLFQENWILLPANLRIIFSLGGKQDALIDTDTAAHSKVFETTEELIKAGYSDATDDDLVVLTAQKIGLVYHGTKNFSNTKWGG